MTNLRQECSGARRLVFMRGEVREVWINNLGAACSQLAFIYACPKPVMTWHLLVHRSLWKVAVKCFFEIPNNFLFFLLLCNYQVNLCSVNPEDRFFFSTFLPTFCTVPARPATTMLQTWTNTGSCNTLAPCDRSTWSSPTSSIERGCRR